MYGAGEAVRDSLSELLLGETVAIDSLMLYIMSRLRSVSIEWREATA